MQQVNHVSCDTGCITEISTLLTVRLLFIIKHFSFIDMFCVISVRCRGGTAYSHGIGWPPVHLPVFPDSHPTGLCAEPDEHHEGPLAHLHCRCPGLNYCHRHSVYCGQESASAE